MSIEKRKQSLTAQLEKLGIKVENGKVRCSDIRAAFKATAFESGPFVIELEPGKYLKSYSGKKRIKFMTTDKKEEAMQYSLDVNAENDMSRLGFKGKIVPA